MDFRAACCSGDVGAVVRMITMDPGMARSRVGYSGMTPLVYAAACGRSRVVSILLQHNADVNARDAIGFTALDYAIRNAHAECVYLLIRAGSKGSPPYPFRCILNMIVYHRSLHVLKAWLEAGEKTDDDDPGKITLQWLRRWPEGTRLLLEAGSTPFGLDRDRRNPVVKAYMERYEVIRMLRACRTPANAPQPRFEVLEMNGLDREVVAYAFTRLTPELMLELSNF